MTTLQFAGMVFPLLVTVACSLVAYTVTRRRTHKPTIITPRHPDSILADQAMRAALEEAQTLLKHDLDEAHRVLNRAQNRLQKAN